MRKSSIIYKVLTTLALFTGITLNFFNTSSAISLASYYTSQSNIICLIAFICYTVMEVRDKEVSYRKNSDVYFLVKGAIVMGILITFVSYHIALAPIGFNMESLHKHTLIKKIANFFVHTCSPLMVICDYFLFDVKGRFKRYYPFLWLLFPANYVCYVYTYSAHGGDFFGIGGSKEFAYFFLDYHTIGIGGVIKWLVFMTACALAVAYLLVYIDHMLAKKSKNWRGGDR